MKKFGSIELGIPAYMTYKGVPIGSLTRKTKSIRTRDGKKSIKLKADDDGKLEIVDKGKRDEDGALEFGTAEVEVPDKVVKRNRLVKTLTNKSKQPTRRKGVQSIRLRGMDDELGKVRILSRGQEVAIVERIMKKLEEAPLPKKDISALKAKFQMAFKRHGFKKAVEQMRDIAKKYAEKGDDKKTEEYLKKLWRSQYGSVGNLDEQFRGWGFYDRYKSINEYLKKHGFTRQIEGMRSKIEEYFIRTDFSGSKFEQVLSKFKRRGMTSAEFKKFVDDRVDDTNKEVNKILDQFDEEAKGIQRYMSSFKAYQQGQPKYWDQEKEFNAKWHNLKKAVDKGKIGDVLRAINFYLGKDKWQKNEIARIVKNMKSYDEGKTKRGKLTNEQIAKQMRDVWDNVFMDEFNDEKDSYFKKGQKELDKLLKDKAGEAEIIRFLNENTIKKYMEDSGEEFYDEFISTEYDILTILSPRSLLDSLGANRGGV